MSEEAKNEITESFLAFVREEKISREEEKKHKRFVRRGIVVFIGLGLLLYVVMFLKVLGFDELKTEDYVSVVQMEGAITPAGANSADSVIDALKKAFDDNGSKGVILRINSPGGTPTQASIIYDNIHRLRSEYPTKKFVVIGEDSLTSGAYMVSVASDKIYANKSSIVGSIGVVMQGYGFPELAKKLGVERRVFTAGENKVRLDPFMPLHEEDKTKIYETLTDVHKEFINIVKEGRGCLPDNAPSCRLKLDTKGLFSGDIWTGSKALEIGLIDEIGDLHGVMKKDFDVDTYVVVATKRPMFGKLGEWLGSEVKDFMFQTLNQTGVYY